MPSSTKRGRRTYALLAFGGIVVNLPRVSRKPPGPSGVVTRRCLQPSPETWNEGYIQDEAIPTCEITTTGAGALELREGGLQCRTVPASCERAQGMRLLPQLRRIRMAARRSCPTGGRRTGTCGTSPRMESRTLDGVLRCFSAPRQINAADWSKRGCEKPSARSDSLLRYGSQAGSKWATATTRPPESRCTKASRRDIERHCIAPKLIRVTKDQSNAKISVAKRGSCVQTFRAVRIPARHPLSTKFSDSGFTSRRKNTPNGVGEKAQPSWYLSCAFLFP